MHDTTGSIDLARFTIPTGPRLRRGLESVFRDEPPSAVVRREPNHQAAYYPSEIVTCRFRSGLVRRLLMKYAPDPDESYGGHLTGPKYERLVYEYVLTRRRYSVPAFHGCYPDPVSGALWSVTEYLDGGVHPDRMDAQSAGLCLAARWVGGFHAAEGTISDCRDSLPLHRYDASFYRRWASWTQEFEGRRRPWLSQLVRRYGEVIERVLARPQVVVHGDYFTDNILIRDGTVYPVDWERAAVASGEIDLATLVVGWESEPDVVTACRQEYRAARWDGAVPADFGWALDGALLHVLFMLLGEDASLPNRETREWRLGLLKETGERLELI